MEKEHYKDYKGKVLYALLSIFAAVFGTATGLMSAVTLGIAHMTDISQYTEKESEHISQWAVEFSGKNIQADFGNV